MKTISVMKTGVLVSALVVLVSLIRCTDVPRVQRSSFITGPETGIEEPEIKVLLEETDVIAVTVSGPFKILGRSDAEVLGSSRDGLEQTEVRAENGVLRFAPIAPALPGRFDLVLSDSSTRVTVNGNAYYGTVRFIADKGTVLAVNVLPIEQYLCGVVRGEMGTVQGPEAFKAQAVAARSYALYEYKSRTGREYHLNRTTVSQVFMARDRYPRAIVQAVNETRGVVMTYDNKLFKAYYSSTCGGRTCSIEDFWDCFAQVPFTSVPCSHCGDSTYSKWKYGLSKGDLRVVLKDNGFRVGAVKTVVVPPKGRGVSERVRFARIEVDEKSNGGLIVLSGRNLRRILGEKNLRSTWFDIRDENGRIEFDGKGFGHGVGMCQVGAIGMAEDGYTYQEILMHYYTGIALQKIYR